MVERSQMKLYPFWSVAADFQNFMRRGANVYQQWNCAHCGVKQTMEKPNMMFKLGKCEECGKETDIAKDGCNYMVHFDLQSDGPARTQ